MSRSCPRARPRPTSSPASPTASSSRTGPATLPAVAGAAEIVRGLVGEVPVFGICLGHQILGLALGGDTYKLRFGHHGANHPVRHDASGRVEITSQNHNYAVDADSLAGIGRAHAREPERRGRRGHAGARRAGVLACSTTRKRAPGPHDARYLFDDFITLMTEQGGLSMPKRTDLESHPHHRQRPDHHRAGVRVRLLGHAGVPRAPRRGLPRRPRELEPGDDHDRPRVRRRHLRRAARSRQRHAHHRAGAARRAAPHARRADRAQPRHRAARGGCARAVRRRAHRRERRGDPHRREPPRVQGGDGGDRPRGAALGIRVHARGRDGDRRAGRATR